MDTTHYTGDDSPYDIRVSSEHPSENVDHAEVARAIRTTLKRHGRQRCTLSVALVGDATMTSLHERFRGNKEPTDVLAFDLGSGGSETVDGEIVISLDAAARASRARGHALVDEVLLYAVHGTLHLLNYDDHTEADARRMHACEDDILTELGTGPVYTRPPK